MRSQPNVGNPQAFRVVGCSSQGSAKQQGSPSNKKYNQMRNHGLAKSLQSEYRSIADMITEIETSTPDVTLRSAAALAQVCRGIITGEGPTVAGRIHFSRSIDADDTALCARILILAGRVGDPVSRAEADALFDINAAASDRRDGGRFEDLLVKAIVHHIMAACGYDVPSRDIALTAATELNAWASEIEIDGDVRYWLERRVREMSGGTAARVITKIISGQELPKELAGNNLFNIAA
jgi:hypothetical protein